MRIPCIFCFVPRKVGQLITLMYAPVMMLSEGEIIDNRKNAVKSVGIPVKT
jgi:hypothetical protein